MKKGGEEDADEEDEEDEGEDGEAGPGAEGQAEGAAVLAVVEWEGWSVVLGREVGEADVARSRGLGAMRRSRQWRSRS